VTDLNLKLRLTADGLSIVGQQVRQTADEVEGLGTSGAQASSGLSQAGREAKETSQAATGLSQTSAQAARRQKELDQAARQAAGAMGALDASSGAASRAMVDQAALADSLGRSIQGLGRPMNAVTLSGRNQQAMMQNLSFQIQDVTQQFALGVNPMTIFAQQGGQVAYALQGVNGRVGQVAAALSGPYGAAALGAVTITAAIATSLWQSAEAAEAAEDATEDLTEAQVELKRIQEGTLLSRRELILLAINQARADLEAAAATRARAKALIEQLRAERQLARLVGGEAGAAVGNIIGGDIRAAEGRIDAAAADAAQIEQALQKAYNELFASFDLPSLSELFAGIPEDVEEITGETNELKDATAGVEAAWQRTMQQIERIADSEIAAVTREVNQLEAAYDPLAAAARNYADELDRIAAFEVSNRISAAQAGRYREGAARANSAAISAALARDFPEIFEDNGERAGQAFAREALARAEAIGQLIGGEAGAAITTAVGIVEGAQSGDFTAIGGRTGGLATILSDVFGENGDFKKGLGDVLGNLLPDDLKLGESIAGALNKIGIEGSLGEIGGRAAGGAAVGTLSNGLLDLIGVKSSQAGAQIGGAIGGAVGGPVGSIVGSLLGGISGGLLSDSTDVGEATINRIGGPIRLEEDNAEFGAAAMNVANAVTEGVERIAEALGGGVGSGAASVSVRNGSYRLDRTGQSLSSTKNGAIDFGQDAEGLRDAAIADLIADGAVTGLSAAVERALRSSPDLEEALAEALKVKALEDELNAAFNPFVAATREFEAQAAERVRIAREYGFDVVEIERRNAEDREALTRELLSNQVGALQSFLDDLEFGSLSEGSASDRLGRLRGEIDDLRDGLDPGDAEANNRLAGLLREFVTLSEDSGGTAGNFAADRAFARAAASEVVSDAERQLAESQKQTAQLDELNDQVSELSATMDAVRRAVEAGGFGGGGFGGGEFAYRIQAR
jgi:hypothetical protein